MMISTSCVLVLGNLSEGFRFVGPFADHDKAAAFDVEHCGGGNWVALLERPKEVAASDRRPAAGGAP